MATLHAPMAVGARADLDAEAAHEQPLHRELFLILHRHAPRPHGVLPERTLRRQPLAQWRVTEGSLTTNLNKDRVSFWTDCASNWNW